MLNCFVISVMFGKQLALIDYYLCKIIDNYEIKLRHDIVVTVQIHAFSI